MSDRRHLPPKGSVEREPSLAEMLADPIVQLLMRRDGVDPVALCGIIAKAQARLCERPRLRPVA